MLNAQILCGSQFGKWPLRTCHKYKKGTKGNGDGAKLT